MGRLSYEAAETLVYDPVAANRTATRSLLYALGFRRIESVSTIEAMSDAIRLRAPDLVLCEAQGAEDHLCQMIQNLRQGATGYNPFLVIIVTAWENSSTLVKSVIDSGADDLILRPFSTTQIGQRITAHIERRKSFVITSEYVGPDRRGNSGRPSNVDLFDPPNSLKIKVKETVGTEDISLKLDAALRAARDTLYNEKLRRDAFHICVLWRLVQDCTPGIQRYDVDLAKLKEMTRAVARRCIGVGLEKGAEHCDAILGALDGLGLGVDRHASMHLLGHAALSLNQVVSPEKSATDHLAEIDATVAIIRARNQTALAS